MKYVYLENFFSAPSQLHFMKKNVLFYSLYIEGNSQKVDSSKTRGISEYSSLNQMDTFTREFSESSSDQQQQSVHL